MSSSRSLFVVLLILIGSGRLMNLPVRAQEHSAESKESLVLSESDAVTRALENSRELAVLESFVKAQERLVDCAWCFLRNPEVRVQDISTQYFYPNENKRFQVGLRWRPPKLGELGQNEQEERVTLWEKKVKAGEFRLKVVADARKTYAECALLQASDALADQEVALEERSLSTVLRLVELGQQKLIDQIKARQRLIKARTEASKVRQRYRDAKNKLAAIIGETKDLVLSPSDPPEQPPDLNQLQTRAKQNRSELGLAEQKAILSTLRYQAVRYNLFPWISFFELAYHYEGQKRDWGELLFGINLPIFNQNRRELDAAATAQKGNENREAATNESITRDITEALSRYNQVLAEWRSLKNEAEAFLPNTEQLLQEAKRRSSLPADEIIDLERSTIEMRKVLLESRIDVSKASIDLCTVVGVERWEELTR